MIRYRASLVKNSNDCENDLSEVDLLLFASHRPNKTFVERSTSSIISWRRSISIWVVHNCHWIPTDIQKVGSDILSRLAEASNGKKTIIWSKRKGTKSKQIESPGLDPNTNFWHGKLFFLFPEVKIMFLFFMLKNPYSCYNPFRFIATGH